MAFTLPDLPYGRDALAPQISKDTLDYHYGKHHQAYVTKLNDLVSGTDMEGDDLEAICAKTHAGDTYKSVYNNAAQVWNHTFYWHSMKPGGGGKPTSKIGEAIERDFGSYEKFREAFEQAGATQFGSGWAWLVSKNGKLEVRKTSNAERPVDDDGATPLLTMDVWEHAYYLDYQNGRPNYIKTWLDSLVNWDFAEENLAKA
jgi:Fe-Mn family superoxide dismutase